MWKNFFRTSEFPIFSVECRFSTKKWKTKIFALVENSEKSRFLSRISDFSTGVRKTDFNNLISLFFNAFEIVRGKPEPFPHAFPQDCGKLLKTCWKRINFSLKPCGKRNFLLFCRKMSYAVGF